MYGWTYHGAGGQTICLVSYELDITKEIDGYYIMGTIFTGEDEVEMCGEDRYFVGELL